jgi:hypothetical protein
VIALAAAAVVEDLVAADAVPDFGKSSSHFSDRCVPVHFFEAAVRSPP